MWPFRESKLGDEISLSALRSKLAVLRDDLVFRLGDDGRLRVSARDKSDVVLAFLDLINRPLLEQVSAGQLFKEEVLFTWEPFDFVVDMNGEPPKAARGPFLLTEIEGASRVDVYTDAPPSEEGAVPTRQLTHDDLGVGWYVEWLHVVTASRPVRIRGRHAPLPDTSR